ALWKYDVDSSNFFSIARTVARSRRNSALPGAKATAFRSSLSAEVRFPARANCIPSSACASARLPCVVSETSWHIEVAGPAGKRNAAAHRPRPPANQVLNGIILVLLIRLLPYRGNAMNPDFTLRKRQAKAARGSP